jgi:hypothetical protein
MFKQIEPETWAFLALCVGVLLFCYVPLAVYRRRDEDNRN